MIQFRTLPGFHNLSAIHPVNVRICLLTCMLVLCFIDLLDHNAQNFSHVLCIYVVTSVIQYGQKGSANLVMVRQRNDSPTLRVQSSACMPRRHLLSEYMDGHIQKLVWLKCLPVLNVLFLRVSTILSNCTHMGRRVCSRHTSVWCAPFSAIPAQYWRCIRPLLPYF